MNTSYRLNCLGSGVLLDDEALPLDSGACLEPAFLRTVYPEKQLRVGPDALGLFKFSCWLPVKRTIEGSSAPATFKSKDLAKSLGLSNLFITFSGYWPERGVTMSTGTFKECEAYSVCSRLPENHDGVLVVASAGNTARAFIDVCSKNSIPLVVVVPEANLKYIWADHKVNPCVHLLAAGGESDYYDAISLAEEICSFDGFMTEGGARNVARRDGMGCTVLSAVNVMNRIPEFYFQSVGSGTGAIAAWEANGRLLGDGRFGQRKMRLLVSQNSPFLVIHDSWKAGSRELVPISAHDARALVEQAYAKVLSNRKPPYSVIGGLYDALVDTNGDVYSVTNEQARKASVMFSELEGIDLEPAAAVTVASLVNAVESGVVPRDADIMLNITGGGFAGIRRDHDIRPVLPSLVIKPERRSKGDLDEFLIKSFN